MRHFRRWGAFILACWLVWAWSSAWGESPATPTPDRLAPPPTVVAPTQADEGAQLYWLHCQPCHGDRGQGLTEEWRNQYPPEDRNCWNAGCHGPRPYEDGFILPTAVPAVVGEGSLARFDSAESLFQFIRAAMPYQAAGSLTETEYLAIIAFLARAHAVWDGQPVDSRNLARLHFQLIAPTPTSTPTPTIRPITFPLYGYGLPLIIAALWLIAALIWRRGRNAHE